MSTHNNPQRGGDGGRHWPSAGRFAWHRDQKHTNENIRPNMLSVPGPKPRRSILTSRPYTRGMALSGPGIDPLRATLGRLKIRDLHGLTGSGTPADPTVAWLFDPEPFAPAQRADHIAIARSVAIANGFACILIRKEGHERQCTYTRVGTRVTCTGANGRAYAVTVPADPHITVYMGPDVRTAMVAGHIFVVKSTDPETGRQVMAQVDDPATQRRIVLPGREAVTEEFWLVRGAWLAKSPCPVVFQTGA